jgi:hypothetical protein
MLARQMKPDGQDGHRIDEEGTLRVIGLSTAIVCCFALMPSTQAGGLLDNITKPINPVGLAIDKATKDVGNANAKTIQDVGKTIEKAAQDTGKTLEKATEDTAPALLQKVMAARSTDGVLTQLMKLPLDKLYALKVSPDICASGTITCEVLTNDKVRPLLDVELDRRKAALDFEDKSRSFLVSVGSLIVSFCAFGLSVFGLMRKGRGLAEA